MLTFTARLTVREGNEETFFATMKQSLPAILGEAGCRAFLFHRVQGNPRQFFFYEQWADQEALDEHNRHLRELGIVLSDIKETIEVEYLDFVAADA